MPTPRLDRTRPLIAALLTAALCAAVLSAGPGAGTAAAAPTDDEHVALQWGLEQIRAPQSWARTRGAGVTIAIVDTGVDLTHPDLAPKLVPGATFHRCPERPEGCGTGSWLDGEERRTASGHGTHVAGIAAGATGNRIGIAGTAPDARVMPVKVLSGDPLGGGTTTEAAAGIRWATRNGADVINLSLGTLPGMQAIALVGGTAVLRDAIRDAVQAGVVVVAAAGNDYASVCSEPAAAPQVICVGAVDRLGAPASYSNLPVDPALNAVAAPGGSGTFSCRDDVVSTWPVDPHQAPTCQEVLDIPGYQALAGTSMAAPHVSGVAALLLAQGRSGADVPGVLRATSRTPGVGSGVYTAAYGYGIVDAEAAVAAPLSRVVERVSGSDRAATAAAVSQRAFTRARTVLLARADEYADALAGSPLSAELAAPLLLSDRDRLSAAAAEEIERLGAREVVLLGREAALSDAVRRDLESRGLAVRRLGGANRFATAVQIAAELPDSSELIVTEGANADPMRGWPDALSASGLAAARSAPILLATRDTLPGETAAVLTASTDVLIVGGAAAISDRVARDVGARSRSVRRIEGADRYATSVAVAREALGSGAGASTIWVATGRAFADGLVAGAAAGATDGILVLIDGRAIDEGSPASRDFLAEQRGRVRSLRAVGGTGAITTTTEARLRELVG